MKSVRVELAQHKKGRVSRRDPGGHNRDGDAEIRTLGRQEDRLFRTPETIRECREKLHYIKNQGKRQKLLNFKQ